MWVWDDTRLTHGADLPTHSLFLGDTQILQGSPAHPRRIASHRIWLGYTSSALSFDLFRWSSQPLDHEDETIPYSRNFGGRKLGELMKNVIFAEKTHADCSLLPRQDATPPNFAEKNLTKSHKTANLQMLAVFPGWSSAYTCYSHAFRSGKPCPGNDTIHVYTYPLDFR